MTMTPLRSQRDHRPGWLIWLFCGAVLLCACGKSPKRAPQPVGIAISGLGLDDGDAVRRDALNDFTRNTGIQVDLIPTPGASRDHLAQMLRLLKAHSPTPDVYVIDVVWPSTLAGELLDLSPWLKQQSGTYLPALIENDTVGGRLSSIPFYMNVGMLFCRRDLLEKYGYRHPPQTWSELETMAARIQRGERAKGNRDFWGYVWQGGEYEGLTCNALEWQASFGGGHVIEQNGTITVNNPAAIQAFAQAARWIGTISPSSVLSYTEADSLNAFRSGNAAFLRYWSSGFSREALRGGVEAALLPAGPKGRARVMGGFQLAVSRYSAHPREAVEAIAWLAGRQVQLRRANRGYLPAIPALYDDPALASALPQAALLRDAGLASWIARPSTVSGSKYALVSAAYYRTVHQILSRRVSAEQGMGRLERELIDITGLHPGAPPE